MKKGKKWDGHCVFNEVYEVEGKLLAFPNFNVLIDNRIYVSNAPYLL
jgi:hypothetical protein